MDLTLQAVYSQPADDTEIPAELRQRLPAGRVLSQHQLATYKALMEPDIDVVINTAMTGDGKSLAGQLPLLSGSAESAIFALYPTNELILDQERSAGATLPQWGLSANRVTTVYGARLDTLAEESEFLVRPEVLQRELKNHRLVLSNPDILHAILQFCYQQIGRDPTTVAGLVAQLFTQLTFDEFHIFDTAEINAVLTGLLFLYEQKGAYPLKTLFLSATPDERLLKPLKRAGFGDRLKVICPQDEGWYSHGSQPEPRWREILRQSRLTVVPQSAEEWVPAHIDDVLLAWFRAHRPGAKAALIVNSVATAHRLAKLLRRPFAAEGLTVATNTRLDGRLDRHASYQADLLIGTSTVDVGVDFRINLLIFEAPNAGTFLQRLGRLGRHGGFEDQRGVEQPFGDFAAYALVPPFVAERLFQPWDGQAPPFQDGQTINRTSLSEQITRVYPPPASFRNYARHWGRFQAAKVIATLSGQTRREKTDYGVRDTYAELRTRLNRRYYDLLGRNVSGAIKDWATMRNDKREQLVREAQSFRGSGAFDCGVLLGGRGEPVTYDLLWLLGNAQLKLIDQETFCAALEQLQLSDKPYRRGYQAAFFQWIDLLPQSQPVTITLPKSIDPDAEPLQARVLKGLEFDCAQPWLRTLCDQLASRTVVALLVPDFTPVELRRRVYTPGHFPLYHYRHNYTDSTGTIVFGRHALLLDSVLRDRKLDRDNDRPFMH